MWKRVLLLQRMSRRKVRSPSLAVGPLTSRSTAREYNKTLDFKVDING